MGVGLRKLVAGNWKMNGTRAALAEIGGIVRAAEAVHGVEVALCPPFTLIGAAVEAAGARIAIGGQDCHPAESGAHTGCVSAAMLADLGASYVIVGHSERRADQHEDDALVRAKALAAIGAGLTAIVCVGESEAQRDAGKEGEVVARQIAGSVPADATGGTLVIAYEPVWAIGTGRTPSVAQVGEMHALIRDRLRALLGEAGAAVRILYGGSVKPENAAELMAVADVDGALVGGASLTAAQFAPIVAAAVQAGG